MELILYFLFLWLPLCFISGFIARNKGRSCWGFFLLSIILSPVIGIIAALVVSSDESNLEAKKMLSGEHKQCLYCAEAIKIEAVVCRYCGKEVQ